MYLVMNRGPKLSYLYGHNTNSYLSRTCSHVYDGLQRWYAIVTVNTSNNSGTPGHMGMVKITNRHVNLYTHLFD